MKATLHSPVAVTVTGAGHVVVVVVVVVGEEVVVVVLV